MLTIHCAACKKKLWKYEKIGHGHVVRCHKDRITKRYDFTVKDHKIHCLCGKEIGIDKGRHYRMISNSFTHTGTKRN
jgi:hypothetical protein